jgi:hypothetical protein
MNEFWFLVAVFVLTAGIAAVWVMGKVVFERWLNNDWCRHQWDMWSGVDKETQSQYRFCRKCNKGERRVA